MRFRRRASKKVSALPEKGDAVSTAIRDHEALSAWFIGPKAENSQLLKSHLNLIVDHITRARVEYFQNDPVRIISCFAKNGCASSGKLPDAAGVDYEHCTPRYWSSFVPSPFDAWKYGALVVDGVRAFVTVAIQDSTAYKREVAELHKHLTGMTDLLSRYSIPSFSPRYMGHMCFDNSLPATLGYLTAMLHNPNNVAVEASPLTSYIEYCVGQQLCKLLGYRTMEITDAGTCPPEFKGWGHITCDGSVANLEAMWQVRLFCGFALPLTVFLGLVSGISIFVASDQDKVSARNLKFYPLSLKWAIEEGGLGFLASSFTISLTRGRSESSLFMQASTTDLLNLKPEVILDIPNRLSQEYGISQQFLNEEIGRYLIQSVGREPLERRYGLTSTPKYIVSKMCHYSWPKGAAVLGVGRDNMEQIDVDINARMDVAQLEMKLLSLTRAGHPIYAVIAIIGATEHGAVDPLDKILQLRRKFQEEHGVSFLIHCDAAWGGYFASLLHEPPPGHRSARPAGDIDAFVPEQALSPYTETQLRALRHADSITLDPHKSGYVPYPAGGLCYRDERAKCLITWSGPYIDGGAGASDVESMGVFGLEGSKPGAAPVAVYLSHAVIGLHRCGYGALLGEVMFTAAKMNAQWATISLASDTLLVAPLVGLPAEREGRPRDEVEAQRRFVRERIVGRGNHELVRDAEAMALLRQMGGDLAINAFVCNFRVAPGGPANTDVAEASYLNARIVARLSLTRVDDAAQMKPLLLMGTELSADRYGESLKLLKRRLGLDEGDEGDLAGMCNVSMNPFPTRENFIGELSTAFLRVAEEEIKNCWKRVQPVPAIHSFIMQGTDDLYLTYLPMFNLGSYRQQLIVSAKLPDSIMKAYAEVRAQRPSAVFTLHTRAKVLLSEVLQKGSCVVDIHEDLPVLHGFNPDPKGFSSCGVALSEIKIVKHLSLSPTSLAREYPLFMPFFLYGTPGQKHIDHILLKAPNAQLSSSRVHFSFDEHAGPAEPAKGIDFRCGVIMILDEVREHTMQPYGRGHRPNFFAPRKTFRVSLYSDPFSGQYGCTPTDIRTVWERLDLGKPLAKGALTLGKSIYSDMTHLNRKTVPELCLLPTEQLTRDELLLSVTEDYEQISEDIKRVAAHHTAVAADDISAHILAAVSVRARKYDLRPVHESYARAHAAVHISRFALRELDDERSQCVAVRRGWKDSCDEVLLG
ncbi:uncharacterized protein FIBRA_09057 [Fibroporia radiculosa]|uniref:Uncharacterized protein n=1 Tax=Fibroporia radiculosa TaxID=599839 RepID=J4H5H7_9APHY|nr:uncharacterized protein FIBRA_09057 [Fibroporia radiculosa]CCM06759.1 predicted protein [Fibroporia radiculosa]